MKQISGNKLLVKALKEEGVIGLADTLVTAESTYRTLLSQLLGRTLVVDTIDHAIVIARKYAGASTVIKFRMASSTSLAISILFWKDTIRINRRIM